VIPAVFSYGMPKTGTTLMLKAFMRCRGVYYCRIREGYSIHPMNSETGLCDVVRWNGGHPIVLVRTYRHPVDVMEALFRIHADWGDAELRRFVGFYRAEFENTARCVRRILRGECNSPQYPTRVVFAEIEFGGIGRGPILEEFLARLAGPLSPMAVDAVRGYLTGTWGRRPSRDGRLRRIIEGRPVPNILSDRQIDYVVTELSDVIAAMRLRYSNRLDGWEDEYGRR